MNRTQATTADITEDKIQEEVEAEIEKYAARMGLCKDFNNEFCEYGKDVPKPFTRRLEGYKVVYSSHSKSKCNQGGAPTSKKNTTPSVSKMSI